LEFAALSALLPMHYHRAGGRHAILHACIRALIAALLLRAPFKRTARRCILIRELPAGRAEVPFSAAARLPSAGKIAL
jgi:hypothetical protein